MRFENKVVLVTGASGFIGNGLAIGFAREGANVIVNYNTDIESAKGVVAKINSLGRKSLVVKADVGKNAEVYSMFDLLEKEFGRLDVLVNNAGGPFPKMPFIDYNEENWDRIQDRNLKSVFLCSLKSLPLLRKSRGCILNISSLHAIQTINNFSSYAAAKAGVEALTRAMAVELGEYGVRVNALRLGCIGFTQEIANEEYQKIRARFPLRREGKVEDVVPAALFLCSEESSYITGQTLVIDGGSGVTVNTTYPKGWVDGGAIKRS